MADPRPPARAWVAPIGTPPDAPGWTEIGTVETEGFVIDDDLVREPWEPLLAPRTITLTSRVRFTWRGLRTLIGTPGRRARQVKTEYHRRRR